MLSSDIVWLSQKREVKLLNHISNLVSSCISDIVMENELIIILEFIPNMIYIWVSTVHQRGSAEVVTG